VARSAAETVEEYLDELPPERREAISAVREVILENLPRGYEEGIGFGMLEYRVPLDRYPETYNGKPLSYVALANQKHYMSLYLMGVYGDSDQESWFQREYRASGKKLDMGKSCVRFARLDDLPLELIGEAVARTGVDDYIAMYERSRAGAKA
jgi:Domain of unknown function (DU1801)